MSPRRCRTELSPSGVYAPNLAANLAKVIAGTTHGDFRQPRVGTVGAAPGQPSSGGSPGRKTLNAAPRPRPRARGRGRRPSPGTARATRTARGRCPRPAVRSAPRTNRPNSRARSASATPGPVVGDRQPQPVRARVGDDRRRGSAMRPPYLTALSSSAHRTWSSWSASATASQPLGSVVERERDVRRRRAPPRPRGPAAPARRPRCAGGARPTRAGSRSAAGGPSATAARTARR